MFTAIWLALNQFANFCISRFTWSIRLGRLKSDASTIVSSAKRSARSVVDRLRSFMKQRNRIGPSMLPWSTDMSRFLQLDVTPPISTH